ncbi:uncharacterized protein FFE2_09455 [Fusarium fujikuroi]|nr:uncharacterized protein FFE2_09455 [Fusarium fujikuroi]SCV50193.1 uncharacterized protein FFFS_09385 [Fusarium fujikuroi]
MEIDILIYTPTGPLEEIVGKGAEDQVEALLAVNTTAQFHNSQAENASLAYITS